MSAIDVRPFRVTCPRLDDVAALVKWVDEKNQIWVRVHFADNHVNPPVVVTCCGWGFLANKAFEAGVPIHDLDTQVQLD
jgi:hypothetical protein